MVFGALCVILPNLVAQDSFFNLTALPGLNCRKSEVRDLRYMLLHLPDFARAAHIAKKRDVCATRDALAWWLYMVNAMGLSPLLLILRCDYNQN
jgi:hypothetical protein